MTTYMNERNVCVGDIISVGKEVVIQVSLPRQPCFKLNHRFSLKNFAPTTYKTSRTGWYYRVLQEGTVAVGDELKLVERKWPEWTIERVQQYLHREKDNLEMNEKLAAVEALGEESRGMFRSRVAKAKAKQNQPKREETWRKFTVTARKMETSRIVSLILDTQDIDEDSPKRILGAHARIKLPNGLIRTYSVVGGDEDGVGVANKFELGIALDDNSRGGSRYIHDKIQVGDTIQVGRVTSDVKLATAASNHIFIVGGIGITAFLHIMKFMDRIHFNIELHYGVRSSDDIPFKDRLAQFEEGTTIYDKSKGERMDIASIIKNRSWNSHIFVCGPNRMLEETKREIDAAGVSLEEIHFEAFAADTSGEAFEVQVSNKSDKTLSVGPEESLLEVLQREFDDVVSSCEVGNCGTCKITVLGGQVEHRGTGLLPEDKENSMLACVSRGIGRIVIEV